MTFYNQVLTPHCQLYSDSLLEPYKTAALGVDVLKKERDKSFINFVDGLHRFWKMLEEGSGNDHQSDRKEVGVNIVNENFSKFKENLKQLGKKMGQDVVKKKFDESPPCPLYETFFNLTNLKYETQNKLEVDGDKREWKNRLCKYLDDNYPDGNNYVYHFPLRYHFETEKGDKYRICEKLDCAKCLSHYSDKIIRELLRQSLGENAEEDKQDSDTLEKKRSLHQELKNENDAPEQTKRIKCTEYERQNDYLLEQEQSVYPGPENRGKCAEYEKQGDDPLVKEPSDAGFSKDSVDPVHEKRGEDLKQKGQDEPKGEKHKKRKKGSKKKEPGLETLVEQYIQRRNALKAVQNVCQRIELWSSRQHSIHIFIMANISYKSYLKHYNKKRTVTENEGDHDILLIIKEIGIVFIQVKSCKDVSIDPKQIQKGFRQILRDQIVFLESNRDLSFLYPNFPMWGFVALPNASSLTSPYESLCGSHKKIVLCKESLEDMKWFDEILNNKDGTSPWTDQQFRYLCARYVGEGKSKGMQELSKQIEAVIGQFGRKIFTPEQKRILSNESPCQVIKGEFGSGKSLLLCKKAYDLSIITENVKQMTDCPIQGKSVLVGKTNTASEKTDNIPFQKSETPTTMIKDQIRDGPSLKKDDSTGRKREDIKMTCRPCQKVENPTRDKIYLITCVGLDKNCLLNTAVLDFPAVQQLQKYVKDIEEQEKVKTAIRIEYKTLAYLLMKYNVLEEPHQNYIKLTADKFNTLFSKLTMECNKIFIDEMPLSLFKDLETYMISKREDYKGYEEYNIWVSIATQSCYGFLDPKNEKPGKLFESHFLEENMRNSCSIAELMRSISIYTGETLKNESNIGHCIEGPIPLLCRIPRCHCPKSVIKDTIFCECFEKRVKDTLMFVHKVLGSTNKNNADVVYMISHFYNDAFESSIFAKLKEVFDRVLKGLDRQFQWFTLADTVCEMVATNFDTKTIESVQGTTKCEVKNKIAKCDPQWSKPDTKEAAKSKKTPDIERVKLHIRTTDSDTETAGCYLKSTESDSLTMGSDSEIEKFYTSSKEDELIIDEVTFAGCERSIVIYIDLLSMWQLLPAEESEGNDKQSSKKTRVGAGSILVPSRCASQYVHIVLQAEEPQIFINEHIRMFKAQEDAGESTEMKTLCNKAINVMRQCLKNHGKLLEKLLDKGVMKELRIPSKLS